MEDMDLETTETEQETTEFDSPEQTGESDWESIETLEETQELLEDTEESTEDVEIPLIQAEEICETEPLDQEIALTETNELDAILSDPDFVEWSSQISADLDQDTLIALWKDVEDRSPREVELVDSALHPDFESQKIFLTDAETGRALQDGQGSWITAGRRLAGSQAPDGFLQDQEGIHLREQKDYTNAYNLLRNITDQTAARRAAFGEDVEITYILTPHFTVGEAEKIQQYCENELGVYIEWQD